jgi:RNA-directed DNA polymerase
MNASKYKANELKKLGALIGFTPQRILKTLNELDNYYREWIEIKENKETGNPKTYMDGTIKSRTIRASLRELKVIQKRIKDKIITPIKLPDQVHGGVKTKSNITNAKAHEGNDFVFTTDLQAFYPNITSEQVYRTFIGFGFSTHISHYLTKLTTLKYELPQGTPTSGHIANLVFMDTDLKLIVLCNRHKITYTRFVDDLTFSSAKSFKHLHQKMLDMVKGEGGSFKISYRKTNYKGEQNITGIDVFKDRIDAPKRIIEKAEAEIAMNADHKPYSIYLNNIRKTNTKKIKSNNNF